MDSDSSVCGDESPSLYPHYHPFSKYMDVQHLLQRSHHFRILGNCIKTFVLPIVCSSKLLATLQKFP
jgi:hypothetical protein